MAGHSKWKNIQHRKGKQDAARGKLFTKISKEIFVAVKQGGPDVATNLRLRTAIQKARQNNMPNSNIEHTVKKASGDLDGVVYEEIIYEGYGPAGVAVMVECLTDNRNRTAAEVRHSFSKYGGNLGESGCVNYLFERKGLLSISLSEGDEDQLMLDVLEAGAEDITIEDDYAEVITDPNEFEAVRDALSEKGYEFAQAEVTQVPATSVDLVGADAEMMIKLMTALEDSDDVQNVYANFDMDDSILESM